jgi:hypothetical protein
MKWKYEFYKKNGDNVPLHTVEHITRLDAGELFSHQNVKTLCLEGDAEIQVKEYLDDEQISMTEFSYEDYYKLRNNRINKAIDDFASKRDKLKDNEVEL